MNGVFLIGGQRGKSDRDASAVSIFGLADPTDGTREAHRLVGIREIEEHVHQVPWSKIPVSGDHGAARGDVDQGVLTDAITSLEQDRASVEVDSVARPSLAL